MPLQPHTGSYNSEPKFFEPHFIAMHRCPAANRKDVDNSARAIERSTTAHREMAVSFQDVESSREMLVMSVLVILMYLVFSYLSFSYFLDEDFSPLDSFYFAVVTFTTVGYGDLKPITDGEYRHRLYLAAVAILLAHPPPPSPPHLGGKVFSIFHALCGVMMIGSGFSILLKNFVAKELEAVEATQNKASEFLVGSMLSSTEEEANESESKKKGEGGEDKNQTEAIGECDTEDDGEEEEDKDNIENATGSVKNLILIWIIAIFTLSVGGVSVGYMEKVGFMHAKRARQSKKKKPRGIALAMPNANFRALASFCFLLTTRPPLDSGTSLTAYTG